MKKTAAKIQKSGGNNMEAKLKRLKPGEMVTAKALADAGHHHTLGNIVKNQEYTVAAELFPLQLLERPAGVLFPFEADPETPSTEGGN